MSVVQRRTATVDIFQGDYLDRLRHLEREFAAAIEAEKSTTRTNDEIPRSEELRLEHEELLEEAKETAIAITLQALRRRGEGSWRDLADQCPPRDGNDEDKNVGVDESKFKDLLVPASILSATVGGKVVDLSEDDIADFGDGDFDRLYMVAFALNRVASADPKGLPSRASLEKTKSDRS